MTRALSIAVAMAVTAAPAAAQSWEARAGWLTHLARRAATFEDVAGTGDGAMQGGEIDVRHRWVGLSVRAFGARFRPDSTATGAGKVGLGEARLRLGPPPLTADLGWGRRTLSGALGSRGWSFVRVGAQSTLPVGGSGLTARVAVGWYPWVGGGGAFGGGGGGDAETRLTYDLPRVPAYLSVGYRIERFTARSVAASRPEEISSLFAGVGLSMGW